MTDLLTLSVRSVLLSLIRRGKEGSSLEESCSFSFWRRGEKGCIVLLRGGRVVELGETR